MCVKTEIVDDASAVKLIVFEESGCGCSASGRFSDQIRGVSLWTPLALQWQAIRGGQVQEGNLTSKGAWPAEGPEASPEASPEAP